MNRHLRQLLCGAGMLVVAAAVAQDETAIGYDYVDFVMRDNTTTRVGIMPDMIAGVMSTHEPAGYFIVLSTGARDEETGEWKTTEYARIPSSDIREMRLVPNPAFGAVETVTDADMEVTVRENRLEVRRMSHPVAVTVATAEGALLMSGVKDAPFSLDLTPYGPGVVIVKAGSLTSKFIVK